MFRSALPVLALSLALAPLTSQLAVRSAAAQTHPDAVLTFHVVPRVTQPCLDPAALDVPCVNYVTKGDLGVAYTSYVVVAKGSFGTGTENGVAGASFGIEYDGAPGSGIDVLQWIRCGDLDFPGNGWPDAGGGNVITFDPVGNCQQTRLGGNGVHAVLGALYVYAYGADDLRITPRNYVPNPDMKVVDCNAVETPLPADRAGYARFTSGATGAGYNPCFGGGGDTFPPTLVAAAGESYDHRILLTFSEPIGFGGSNPANYQVTRQGSPGNSPLVLSVSVASNQVTLNLDRDLADGATYTIVVNNVEDAAGNVIAPNSSISFTAEYSDAVPPTLVRATGTSGSNQVTVYFSEPVGVGATNPANYAVLRNGAVAFSVQSVGHLTDRVVLFLNAALTPATYEVRVSNVRDLAGNTIAINSSVFFNVAGSGPLSQPRVAVHVRARATKVPPCDNAPHTVECQAFAAQGNLHTPYDIYVVVADPGASDASVAGLSFGVDYAGAAGTGVDVAGWTSCGDLSFPSQTWPLPGSGNVVTWAAPDHCQSNSTQYGLQVAVGSFYVYAYGNDLFRITRRENVSTPDLKVVDCQIREYDIPYPDRAGVIGFGQYGYNPCWTAVPVEKTTWGAIKRTYGGKPGN